MQSLLPVFDGESYDFWSIQIRILFISQDLWDLIEHVYEYQQIKMHLRHGLKQSKECTKRIKEEMQELYFLFNKGQAKLSFLELWV